MRMIEEEAAKILLEIKAVTLEAKEPYRYASGILSPIYCDNRLLMGFPEKRRKIIEFFMRKIEENNLEFDVIAGTATAGIPHAAWLADRLGKPMIYARKAAKGHGKGNLIEGKLEEGQKVLLIEDLISTGGSSVAAVEAIRNAGGVVSHCLAIFTYEMEKAAQRFDEINCNILTLGNFSVLVNVAREENYINEEEEQIVLEWNKNPSGWGQAHGFE